MWNDYFPKVDEAAAWLQKRTSIQPRLLVVLSGGLDAFATALEKPTVLSTRDIPHFPQSRAEGHAGKLVFGTWKGIPLVVCQGRQHYYEGHAPQEVVFPYFVLNALGVKTLITTNAVGGIRHDLNPGDILLVTDHINMMGTNPLIGLAIQRKTDQFTSMTNAYHADLRELAKGVATKQNITLKEGVYIACTGPSYETPAEIKSYRTIGADTVGMSTVFEVTAANFLGMKVLTLSIITNPAADRHGGVMNHAEVLEAMKGAAEKVVNLLRGIVEEIGT